MKTHKLLAIGLLLFFAGSVQSQISVQLNIGTPPQWGPTGYTDVRYYYLPDVEAYYDVPSSMFIYYNGVRWIHRTSLPVRYRNYDLYSGYKVVMSDYRGNTPYSHFREHKRQYAKGYHGQNQPTYGHRPDRGNSERGFSNEHSNQKYRKGNNDGHQKGNNKNMQKSRERGRAKGKH